MTVAFPPGICLTWQRKVEQRLTDLLAAARAMRMLPLPGRPFGGIFGDGREKPKDREGGEKQRSNVPYKWTK